MLNVFFSYSHHDENLRNELEKHLSILKRQGIISACHDRRITAGSELDVEISNYLKTSQIILLLISSDFLNSDYCYDKEMKFAMEQHERGKAVVIPIILRSCDWQGTPFGKLMAVPKDGKPIVKYQTFDDAFLEVTDEIKRVVNKFSAENIATDRPLALPTIFAKSQPRSSNLTIRKKFSDHEIDRFLDDAFEYISAYFEGSLQELQKRNRAIEYRFKKNDSQSFSASIYFEGNAKAECMVFLGSQMYGKGISYSQRISQSFNSHNEILIVEEDGYNLHLRSNGFTAYGKQLTSLTFEGAAELYWEILMRPLQDNH